MLIFLFTFIHFWEFNKIHFDHIHLFVQPSQINRMVSMCPTLVIILFYNPLSSACTAQWDQPEEQHLLTSGHVPKEHRTSFHQKLEIDHWSSLRSKALWSLWLFLLVTACPGLIYAVEIIGSIWAAALFDLENNVSTQTSNSSWSYNSSVPFSVMIL